MTIEIKDTSFVTLIVAMVFLVLSSPLLPHHTYGLSPSFARQDILNNNHWSIDRGPRDQTIGFIHIPPTYLPMPLAKNLSGCGMGEHYPRPYHPPAYQQ